MKCSPSTFVAPPSTHTGATLTLSQVQEVLFVKGELKSSKFSDQAV